MEKLIIEDGSYKFIYRLPSQSILEFEFSFKKDENYETIMFDNFEQENIPKIILSDINILMKQFLKEEGKEKKYISKTDKENLDSKYFLQKLVNHWLSIRTFKNHLELNTNNNKHINQIWKKYVILKHYKKTERLNNLHISLSTSCMNFENLKKFEEIELRNKQEREMQEANLKNLQLDLIVNRHINEINKFSKDYQINLIELLDSIRDNFVKSIETSYQEFFENIDSHNLIYNSENKLIQLSIKRDNLSSLTEKCGEISSSFYKEIVKFGIFNRFRLNLYFYNLKDYTDSNFKNHLHRNNENEDNTLNDIYKLDQSFGEHNIALLNFFTYDKGEERIIHLIDSLNSYNNKVHSELFFESFLKFFNKIEKHLQKEVYPFNNDIFVTKHSNFIYDIILNIYKQDESQPEDLNTIIKNVIYFINIYKINALVIPIDKIAEKYFRINKFSEMNNLLKCIKQVISIIKNKYALIVKSGIKIYLKNIYFIFQNSFIIGFDKNKTIDEFINKFNSLNFK